MTDEMRRLAADTRHLGGFLLARLPLGLAGADGQQLLNDLLPPPPGGSTTSAPSRPRIN